MKLIFISFLIATILFEAHGQLLPRKQGGSPGGMIDANDPETYAEIRRLMIEGVCDEENCFKLIKIDDVKRQVVAGVKYEVKGMFKEVESRAYYKLTLTIYHVVWEDKTECKDIFPGF
jgi:hypothetical protein